MSCTKHFSYKVTYISAAAAYTSLFLSESKKNKTKFSGFRKKGKVIKTLTLLGLCYFHCCHSNTSVKCKT